MICEACEALHPLKSSKRGCCLSRCLQTLWQLMGQCMGCFTACCHQVGLPPTLSLFLIKALRALSGPRTVAAGGISEEMWDGKLRSTIRIPPTEKPLACPLQTLHSVIRS